MSRRGSMIAGSRHHEDPYEEETNIIRSSRRMMVPELRASVRERVSNLRPEGLPLPGKTTQGFRGSHRSSSRESVKPKSFRTVRNFWRRLEGTDDAPPRRSPRQLPEKPKTSGWKFPVLRRISNARESARRISQRKSPSIEDVKKLVSTEEVRKSAIGRKRSKQSSIGREQARKSSIGREQARKSSIGREQARKSSIGREQARKSSIGREQARKSSIGREQARKSSIGKEQAKRISIGRKKSSMRGEQAKRSLIENEESRKSSRKSTLKNLTGRGSSERTTTTRAPSGTRDTLKAWSRASANSKLPSRSTVPPPAMDFAHISGSRHSRQERPSSIRSAKGSKLTARESNLEQVEEGLEEGGYERDERDERDRDDDEEDEEDKGDEIDEEESDLDEEMEEEEEEEPHAGAKPTSTDAAVSPPTAVLRPSSLWAALPRMFSDESLNRPSVILPVLLEEEKLFHELVAGGDVSAVNDFISKRPKFNINCENYQGTSALHIAVREDNEDMVQFLLSLPGIEVRDSHLFAIRDNHSGILVMILDKLQSINPALEFMACSNSPEFAENITPLILAAEAGHFEIVGLLISRGHIIPRPHKPRCFCKQECQAIMKSQDMLSISSGKLHIYRALSNPAYICQTSPDPLLVAFKLSKELLTCGHVDTIYLRQYEALAESLRAFAVEIIAECRTLEEVETILSESKDTNLKGHWRYPRLILALDYKQKEFIAHPNVQQVLERTWMGDWTAWRGYRVYVKALYVFPRLLTLPLVLVVLMFTPTSKWARHFSLPVNKLLSNVASYCIFLLLVFIQSNVNKKNQTRDTKPTGVEIFLVIYVLTFIFNSIRSLMKQGVHRFFNFMWNIYELVMELFFIMAFVFLIAAEIKTTIKGDKDVERKYWYYLDPELVSESFFVLASVMAFMRILLIFQISYHLGPLQVSLGKMTNDCAMFSLIFAIIIMAFTAGLCKFYSYYEDMVQTNPDTGDVESSQVNSFTSVLDTFKTLFWGLFGMSSFDVADVIIENIEEGNSNSTTTNEHHLTEAVGYFTFATYMILTVIVILNMLIATMSNTFQKVTDNVDIEWLFGRTEVYMSYIDLPVLPPPFNVIPTTHSIVNLFKGHKNKGAKLIGVDVEKGIVEERDNLKYDDYYVLMSQLVQRYFSTKNSEND